VYLQRKELNHDNIEQFIGASTDPGHICYLMQRCTRGTVQVSACLYIEALAHVKVTYSELPNTVNQQCSTDTLSLTFVRDQPGLTYAEA